MTPTQQDHDQDFIKFQINNLYTYLHTLNSAACLSMKQGSTQATIELRKKCLRIKERMDQLKMQLV